MSNEPTDALCTKQMKFSYAKVHATAARALMHDPTWLFDASFPENPHKYPHTLLIIWVCLYSDFRGRLQNVFYATQCIMGIKGHSRSLILAPIESMHVTFYYP